MNTTSTSSDLVATLQPRTPRHIPLRFADIEIDLHERFLGDDLNDRCTVAASLGDPVFLATAALPLDNRREAVSAWRKRVVENLERNNAILKEFIGTASHETRVAIREGRVDLMELDRLVAEHHDVHSRERMDSLNKSKEALREAVRLTLGDGDDGDTGNIVPGAVVILASGKSRIFRRRIHAVEWARSAGCRYLLAEIDRETVSIHPGTESD